LPYALQFSEAGWRVQETVRWAMGVTPKIFLFFSNFLKRATIEIFLFFQIFIGVRWVLKNSKRGSFFKLSWFSRIVVVVFF